jgi:hypothetical protein
MMIYSIELSDLTKRRDFETFMLDEVFPAVDKGAWRSGQITGLVLLGGKNTNLNTNQYLWLVHGAIGGGTAASQLDKIKAFGAQISPMNEFSEVGRWFAHIDGQRPLKEMLG